jgi:hypothetical protein
MIKAPPTPNIMARLGAPESAKPKMAQAALIKAPSRFRGKLANAKNSKVAKQSCANAGVASCDSLAKPTLTQGGE